MPLSSCDVGLATKSTAPISSAWMVTSALACVSVETITTGSGCSAMILRRNDRPSIRGISTSSVMTSGLSDLIMSRRDIGIRRSTDDLDLRIGRQQHRQKLPDETRVVDDKNTNLWPSPHPRIV